MHIDNTSKEFIANATSISNIPSSPVTQVITSWLNNQSATNSIPVFWCDKDFFLPGHSAQQVPVQYTLKILLQPVSHLTSALKQKLGNILVL